MPLGGTIGSRHRQPPRQGTRRREPFRWNVRMGRRGVAGRSCDRPRTRRTSRRSAQLRDRSTRAHRWSRDAERPLLRAEPLRDTDARSRDLAARRARTRRSATEPDHARRATAAVRHVGRHAGVRGKRPLPARPAGGRRAMAPGRGEHRRVDRRTARRGARPRRGAVCSKDDRVPGRGCRRSRGVSGHPLRARPVSGRGAQLPKRFWPTR